MQATGIHIDGSLVRWATVKWDGKRLRLICWHTELSSHVKRLYTECRSVPLVSGLSSNDLIIRQVSFKTAPSRKLLQALIVQVQTQLHFKPEESISLVIPHPKERLATIYSTTDSALDTHLSCLKQLQVDPERVSALPAALLTFMTWKAPHLQSYFLVDVGQVRTSCVWVENGKIQKAHDTKLGLASLKTAFHEDRKKLISLKERDEIDFSGLKSGQYPILAEEARNYRREVSRYLHSFQCQRPVIFIGDLEVNGYFKEFLLESLRDCVLEEIKPDLTPEERLYAGCFGLAIDYLLQRKTPIQFRTQSKTSPCTWQKLGTISFGLLAASFLICGTFYEISSWWINKRKSEMTRSLENWAATKDPELRFELFSVGDKMESLVQQWLSIIEKNSRDYTFLMKAPKVASFLHWLSTHPLIDSFSQTGDPISFEQIHYHLESFPKLEALRDPYLAKVEIEFKLLNPLHARKLHEAILQDSLLVDVSRDVTWDVLPDRYRTSFYLKNNPHGIF